MARKRGKFGLAFIERLFGKKDEKQESFFTKELKSPLNGKVVNLSDVDDETFASGTMGQGCAIEPEEGYIFSPCDGVVSVLPQECYAIGITSLEGIDILIHVGLDTIKLGGKYFTANVKEGDSVKAGQLLLKFDMEGIKREGYSLVTSVVVSNTDDFASATTIVRPGDSVKTENTLLVVEN